MWETADSVIGSVRYGAPGRLEQRASEEKPVTIHKVRLQGLEPQTGYAYRVEYAGVCLDEIPFRTFPRDGSRPWRIVVYGDSRSNPEIHASVVRGILAAGPALVIHTGDFTTDAREHEQWKPQYFDPAAPLMRSVAVFPAIGNHEYNTPWFYRYFDLEGSEAGKAWYSFDAVNAHIVVLNSDTPYAPWDKNSEQTRWLIDDLARHASATWKIVAFHHPPFSARNLRPVIPQRWLWHPIFEQYGVDIVFNGHDHHYFRTYAMGTTGPDGVRRGIPYVVTGGGGAPVENADPQDYGAVTKQGNHFTSLDLEADRLTLKAIDDSGVFDSLTVLKSRGLSADQFASYPAVLFKINLANAIYKSAPLAVKKGTLHGKLSLEVPTYFKIPLKMELRWKNTGSYKISPDRFSRVLKPGDTFRLNCDITSGAAGDSPAPMAQAVFSLLDGGRPFVNDTVVFFPLKTLKTDPLPVKRLSASPEIDGRIDEELWKKTIPLCDFYHSTAQHDPGPLERSTLVRLGHAADTLYVAAVLKGAPNPSRKEKREKDDLKIIEDECFAVNLGFDKKVYNFVVASSGALLDAMNSDPSWNGNIDFAVQDSDSAWTLEMKIPLDQFGSAARQRINLIRSEYNGLLAEEWNPSYLPVNRSYSLPAYGIDWKELKAMVPLVLSR